MKDIHEGNILKAYIKDNSIVKVQLAKKLGVHVNTLYQWLDKSKIRSENLIDIGRELRIDISSLIPRMKTIPEAEHLQYYNEDRALALNQVKEAREEYKSVREILIDRDKEITLLKNLIQSKDELIAAQKEIIAQKELEISKLKKTS